MAVRQEVGGFVTIIVMFVFSCYYDHVKVEVLSWPSAGGVFSFHYDCCACPPGGLFCFVFTIVDVRQEVYYYYSY